LLYERVGYVRSAQLGDPAGPIGGPKKVPGSSVALNRIAAQGNGVRVAVNGLPLSAGRRVLIGGLVQLPIEGEFSSWQALAPLLCHAHLPVGLVCLCGSTSESLVEFEVAH